VRVENRGNLGERLGEPRERREIKNLSPIHSIKAESKTQKLIIPKLTINIMKNNLYGISIEP
jgi:hypothetical protein